MFGIKDMVLLVATADPYPCRSVTTFCDVICRLSFMRHLKRLLTNVKRWVHTEMQRSTRTERT